MSRPDQSIAFLRQYGFSVFRFPRASAQPLELMHRNGKDLTRLGTLLDLVEAGSIASIEVRRETSPGIDIEGKETSRINVAIGLSLLGSFVGALGGGKVGLDTAFKNARTVTFEYAGVMEDAVDILGVEKFIKGGRVSTLIPSGTLEKLLDDEVYVLTSVLKTKKIVVTAQGEGGTAVQVDVPAVRHVVGANVKVDTARTRQSRVAFEGPVPVAFAFQAVQLVFDDSGEFLTTQQLPAGDVAARALKPGGRGGPRRTPVFLETRGAFVRATE